MSANTALAIVILAAGQGTRMKSRHAKVLHRLGGRPLVCHVLESCRGLAAKRTVVVVGHQADAVEAACKGYGAEFALQREQRGTGHAAMAARDAALAGFRGDVVILYGDVPLLTEPTLRRLLGRHRDTGSTVSLLTTVVDEPFGYGRIVRDGAGRLERIVEQRDASEAERAITEVNPGIYCVKSEFLFPTLDRLRPTNDQGELYLTDVVGLAVCEGLPVATEPVDPHEVAGINSRADLAALEETLRRVLVRRHMDAGVTFLDPGTAWIEADVTIGADTTVGPMVQIRGKTRIGSDCQIDGNAFLVDAEVADRVHLRSNVVLSECSVAEGSIIGPFSHLRPGADLGPDVHVGNFVEVKKSTIGANTKANHLAYIGDATIGRDTNIGAGTITCNYDGFAKHRTTIGDRVQIGSDSQLVAPVEIGDDAYVATGTTVRHDVEPGALAFNPKPDQRRPGWVEGFRQRRAKKKA
ncbi:MAG: UDP-N-acetylglucosamine diphosphorylase/glucosamine-1-phosphate N-acetyltransferase [Deltaproteobacteria bacterium]|nr:UDP-N-acetylglucosamine diphosphorylase/glucosamine-1-phosphate N-acetyltransferase [Deltaproteobacteria bacterium]